MSTMVDITDSWSSKSLRKLYRQTLALAETLKACMLPWSKELDAVSGHKKDDAGREMKLILLICS